MGTATISRPDLFRPPLEVPKAFVVRRPGHAEFDAEAVAGFVRGRLASYKTPAAVEFLDAIPRTPSGKILRRILKEREPHPSAR
jgi:acyl-CoA synthetase (AMP-forming)/AMP-acid ligase II